MESRVYKDDSDVEKLSQSLHFIRVHFVFSIYFRSLTITKCFVQAGATSESIWVQRLTKMDSKSIQYE